MPLPTGYTNPLGVRGKHNKQIAIGGIYHWKLTDAAALVTNGISVSHVGASAASTRNMTLGGSLYSSTAGRVVLDKPRNVVITVTHGSAVVAMSGVITGTDEFGKTLTEAWSVAAGGTTKTFTGKKAFKTITQITEVVAADASTNTIVAGSGKVFGLPVAVSCPSPVKEMASGSVVTNGTLVAASTAAADDPRGTYTPNANPDGSADFELWVLTDNPAQ